MAIVEAHELRRTYRPSTGTIRRCHVVSEAWTWVGVAGALTLASVGVYLGRFVRFNWDALTRPGRVGHVLAEAAARAPEHSRMAAAMVALTGFMFVGYLLVYGFAGVNLEVDGDR